MKKKVVLRTTCFLTSFLFALSLLTGCGSAQTQEPTSATATSCRYDRRRNYCSGCRGNA